MRDKVVQLRVGINSQQQHAACQVHEPAGALYKLVCEHLQLLLGSKLRAKLKQRLFVVVSVVVDIAVHQFLDPRLQTAVRKRDDEDEQAEPDNAGLVMLP